MSRNRSLTTLARALRSGLTSGAGGRAVGGGGAQLMGCRATLPHLIGVPSPPPPPALPFAARPFASSGSEDDGDFDYNFIEYPASQAFVGQPAPGFKADGTIKKDEREREARRGAPTTST